jgi:hypothetical protein
MRRQMCVEDGGALSLMVFIKVYTQKNILMLTFTLILEISSFQGPERRVRCEDKVDLWHREVVATNDGLMCWKCGGRLRDPTEAEKGLKEYNFTEEWGMGSRRNIPGV